MPTPRQQAESIGTESSNFTDASEDGRQQPPGYPLQVPKERDYAAHSTNPKDPPIPAKVSSK